MNKILFENFKRNAGALALYAEGLTLLKQSGILELLLEASRVKTARPEQDNFVDTQAAYANQSIGYSEALEDLIYFREKYVYDSDKEEVKAEADYGALDLMLARHDIDQTEYDKLKAGQSLEEVFAEHDTDL